MNCNRISMGQVASGTMRRYRDERARWAVDVQRPKISPPASPAPASRTLPATLLPPQRDAA
jgi:hypothetical protein